MCSTVGVYVFCLGVLALLQLKFEALHSFLQSLSVSLGLINRLIEVIAVFSMVFDLLPKPVNVVMSFFSCLLQIGLQCPYLVFNLNPFVISAAKDVIQLIF